MPVLTLKCPECNHVFRGMVLAGTREPEVWICSQCGSQAAYKVQEEAHPWDGPHGIGLCPCCAPTSSNASKSTNL